METARQDVYNLLNNTEKEEEEVTQDQFNAMMNVYLQNLSKQQPDEWSKEARDWCEKNGVIQGDDAGNKSYKKFLTREEMAQMVYRLHK